MKQLILAIASFVLTLGPSVADDRPVKDDQPTTQRIDWD